jgi:hypothetical protein
MACPAADQEIDHASVCVVVTAFPTGGPADHAARVVIAFSDHIAAGIRQCAHHLEVALRRNPMHGVGVVALFAIVHVQASLEQQLHRIDVTALCRWEQQ